jgi:hypothetical protein
LLALYGIAISAILNGCVIYESSLRSRAVQPLYQSQSPYSTQFPNQGFPNQGSPNQGNPNQTFPNQGFPYQQDPNQPPPSQTFPNNAPQGVMNQGFSDMSWQNNANRPVTFQMFYDELYPHGEWLNVPEYGFVWRPYNVDANWQPYLTNGRWVYTRFGWTWASNYSWGWATFHYGRWRLDPFYGWYWVPGNVWGPAWVEWRQHDGHYWWVPLPPNVVPGGNFSILPRAWNVVPARFIMDPFCQNYALRFAQFRPFINNTTIINNTYVYNNVTYPAGPAANDVSRYVGGKVIPLALRNLNQPGASAVSDNSVGFFAPSVQAFDQNNDAGKMRPANFTPAARATQGKAGVGLFSDNDNGTNTSDGTSPQPSPQQGQPVQDNSGLGGKSRPVNMPTPVDNSTPNPSANPTDPTISPAKKSSPVQLQEQGNPPSSSEDSRIPRYAKPRPTSPNSVPEQEQQQFPAQQKSNPFEQPRQEQPRSNAPQPVQERKSNPFEQPRQEQPRQEAPKYEAPKYEAPKYEQPRSNAPQPVQERKSNPFEQPRQEQPRQEAPKYEAPKYEAPKYEQPRYERAPQPATERKSNPFGQPRQETPRYEAPKQSAPPPSNTPQPYQGKKGGGD